MVRRNFDRYSPRRPRYRPEEILPRLCLHLDPVLLLAQDALVNVPMPWQIVRGERPFLVCTRRQDHVLLVPTTRREGNDRLPISSCQKTGHPAWRQAESFVHCAQVWRSRVHVLPAVAAESNDLSRPGLRNRVVADALLTILDHVRAAVLRARWADLIGEEVA